ncbi:MAG: hypothetical protein QW838_04250 [Candidatus Nitrosotenuis sp.]
MDAEIRRVHADYQQYRELIVGARRQRFLRLKPRPLEAYQEFIGDGVRVPISFRLVETAIGTVAGQPPRFQVVSPDQELARRAAKWIGFVMQAQGRFSQKGFYWKFWDSLLGDGVAYFKTIRTPWTDAPLRAEGETDAQFLERFKETLRTRRFLPFRTRVVDPATVFPPRHEWGGGPYLESGLRSTQQTLHALGLRPVGERLDRFVVVSPNDPAPINMSTLARFPTVYVDELWTNESLLVRIAGQVWEYENELGRVPYIMTPGSALAFSDPTLAALPVSFPLFYLEPWVNQFLSTLVGKGTLASASTPVISRELAPGTAASAGETTKTDFQAGKLHDLPPGARMDVIELGLDQGSVNLLNVMIQLAERFTLSPVPQFAGTRTPGVVISAVAERVAAVLTPRLEQARESLADLAKLWLELARDLVRLPVVVSGFTMDERSGRSRASEVALAPREINKISDVLVELKFQTIQDRIAWDMHNIAMKQAGLWSEERAMRESGVDDPEGEQRDLFIERLLQHPAIQLYVAQKGMEGQAPLQALSELLAQAPGGAPDLAGLASEEAGRAQGGRVPGEPRLPGGTRRPGVSGLPAV